ncbi:MAG: class I SAM-dependent methyltransferase [Lachnospiraceae bacterium]
MEENKIKLHMEKVISQTLCDAVLSNPREKNGILKVRIRPILLKEKLTYQIEEFIGKQVFHKNLPAEDLITKVEEYMTQFRQAQLTTEQSLSTILVSKKGSVTITSKQKDHAPVQPLEHNRSKHYILEEGTPIPFLIDLGVMTEKGKIITPRYDKFRQINRFLEFIQDILPSLDKNRQLTIIDFGCGKSYLTFAMYYYLKILNHYDVHMIGLDLKDDVIAHCNALAQKYHYDSLEFLHGDIADFNGVNQVDMVVTLHACDTATDYALLKAIRWNAKVILSVPCCQHELNRQMHNEILEPALHYGLIKERMAALYTDALRAEILENQGYRTQILEFIDMEHTPKNILIRAVNTQKPKDNHEEIERLIEFLQVEPTLWKKLQETTTF